MCKSLFCSHSCWLNSQADKLACWDDFCCALHKCWPQFNPRGTSGSLEHTVSKVKSIKCMRCISHACFWELLPQNNANGLVGFLPLCNLRDGCPALWLNLPVHASPFFSFHIHFAQPHIRAGRYDDTYRLDDRKCLLFHMKLHRLYRSVAKTGFTAVFHVTDAPYG